MADTKRCPRLIDMNREQGHALPYLTCGGLARTLGHRLGYFEARVSSNPWSQGLPLQSRLLGCLGRHSALSVARTRVSERKGDLVTASGQGCSAVLTIPCLGDLQGDSVQPFRH